MWRYIVKKNRVFTADIIFPISMALLFLLYAYLRVFYDSMLVTAVSVIAVVSLSVYYSIGVRKKWDLLYMQKADIKRYYDDLSVEYDKLKKYHYELKSKYEELEANQVELIKSKERLQSLFDYSQEALWEYDVIEEKWYLSNRILEMYNLDKKWAETRTNIIFNKLIHPDDKYYVLKLLSQVKSGKMKKFSIECRILTNDEYRWARIRGAAFFNGSGNLIRVTGSYSDIQIEKTKEEKLLELACVDPITELPNKLWLSNYLESLVKSNNPFILMCMDLDNFKVINDTFGNVYGDVILKKMGIRLKDCTGEGSFVCKISGDEFAILVTDKDKVDGFDSFIEEFKDKISEPIRVDENEFHFTFSIGIAVFPEDGQTADDLMKNADTAMLKAKSTGKNLLRRFEKHMNDELYEKLLLERDIRKAIENGEFHILYQPQVCLEDFTIIGLESLIRWVHPERGCIEPVEFIPLAEEVGLINRIGEWVFTEACKFSAKINKRRTEPIPVSVNVSPVQLLQHDFLNSFINIIEKTGVNPAWMVIEITESALMEPHKENALKLKQLKKIGIKIALDDFGTGYSSMKHLQGLPVDIMKIDRSFIKGVSKPGNGGKLTEAMIILAHRLGMRVVAEGVEEVEQYQVLKKYGCDVAQGYLLYEPVPENKVIKIINKRSNIVPEHIYQNA
jgi:diguanylate cyclase (GGDEF)-like protein/PAS domain S-box-containing protein